MVHQLTLGRKVFNVLNYAFLIGLSVMCILPLIHVLAISLSDKTAAASGNVTFLPVNFTWQSYTYVLSKPEFMTSFWISVERVALGTVVNMLLTIVMAYPLSKEVSQFRWRTAYAWFLVLTILFSGGLIPTYMVVNETHLMDTIWALIVPGAVPVFNVILLLNFFRGLPKELEEAAFVDGARPWTVLWRLFVPLSTPALATIGLFTIVGHWNSWFDGLIYMNNPSHYPLQSYLQTVIIKTDLVMQSAKDINSLAKISERTSKAAQIFMGALPILVIYPFLQRYFVKGIVLGSVKE
ncbi:putative aldouronate transport system permease protein [Paenibacillus rhizosphaerae]|uniref:Putative aldouronate transport system permease protein n=1 Tax=Paenibacillus rhizosphaerae TaxID=297318 RepID=A0A839TT41_9BACL|nr:carbohydrate ABC transporter permease [Paenibacillus rhizosphaerae]MBB3128449.1 putative aldouronate transport system permease protein [Paenibacillus rhizosphaerae]